VPVLHFFPHGHCNVRGIEIVLFSVVGIEIVQRRVTLQSAEVCLQFRSAGEKKDELLPCKN
jgi:hypothetical protein